MLCEDNAEPAWCGTWEGLTAAQNHLVFEETPPERQFLLKGRRSEELQRNWEKRHILTRKEKNIWNTCCNVFAGLYLSEVSPDIESSGPLQVRDTHTLQLPLQETVSSLQPASVFRQELFADPLWQGCEVTTNIWNKINDTS